MMFAFKLPNGDVFDGDTELNGELIKRIRCGWNLSQACFGEMLGVSQKTVSSWETDKCELPAKTLMKIFNIFLLPCYVMSH